MILFTNGKQKDKEEEINVEQVLKQFWMKGLFMIY